MSTRQLRELGWSESRIKAYVPSFLHVQSYQLIIILIIMTGMICRFQQRKENPNHYYYRFNDPGELQETGKWSAKTRSLFLKQLVECGMDYAVRRLRHDIGSITMIRKSE